MTEKEIVIIDDNVLCAMRSAVCDAFSYYFKVKHYSSGSVTLKNLENSNPVFIIAFNDMAISDEIVGFAEKKELPLFIWLWDFTGLPLKYSPYIKYFYSFDECKSTSGLDEGNSHYLPFSTDPVQLDPNIKKEKPVMFLGTCWNSYRLAQNLAGGIRNESGEILVGEEAYNYIADNTLSSGKILKNSGKSIDGGQLRSMLSALERCHILANFIEKGIDVYGGEDWQLNLWGSFPWLIPSCKIHKVYTNVEMKKLMRDYKVALNIFHVQNRNGGPNFRILDSALTGCAILSNYNEKCASFFPHGEAAFYFKDNHESLDFFDQINNDDFLRKKLIVNAADIVNDSFTHDKRLEFFCEQAGVKLPQRSKRELVRMKVVENRTQAPESLVSSITDTDAYKIEQYYSNILCELDNGNVYNIASENEGVINPKVDGFLSASKKFIKWYITRRFSRV